MIFWRDGGNKSLSYYVDLIKQKDKKWHVWPKAKQM